MNALDRYSRQITLKSFGADKQRMLGQAKVLIVGLGGLGVPVAQYLSSMGIGTLGLVENDTVDLHNLQRQVIYPEAAIGKAKLQVAMAELQKRNSAVELLSFATFLNVGNALEISKDFDVVVDATDNFASRYLINDACTILNKPLVYGALHDFEGQVSVFNYKNGPTYRCLFPNMPTASEIPNCDENGVLGVLPGIIGTLQALEVVKVITGVGETLSGKLLLYDGLSQTMQKIKFHKNPKNLERKVLEEDYGPTGCETIQSVPWDAYEKIQDPKQLIDVRTHAEFKENHVPGAINIPLADLEQQTQKLDMSKTVYLVCQSGKRSATAVEILTKAYPNAVGIQILGGMNAIPASCL